MIKGLFKNGLTGHRLSDRVVIIRALATATTAIQRPNLDGRNAFTRNANLIHVVGALRPNV